MNAIKITLYCNTGFKNNHINIKGKNKIWNYQYKIDHSSEF
jgi:hypothetical protein